MSPTFWHPLWPSMLLVTLAAVCCHDDPENIETEHDEGSTKVLSRKKRFLVFPEGSSLQLVFCLTYPSINVIGDIILWGNTAALAWELPQDPYSPFDHHADPLHRRQDNGKNVYYTDSKGKLLFKVPYKRKPLVNPAFAKRSVDYLSSENFANITTEEQQTETEIKLLRDRMHARQATREFLKMERLSDTAVDFHRQSRRGLFEKLEIFMMALGLSGRECLLKTLCEVGQSQYNTQGTFVQELMRTVFTLPKGQAFMKPQHQEYDQAHGAQEDCHQLYPKCHTADENALPQIML